MKKILWLFSLFFFLSTPCATAKLVVKAYDLKVIAQHKLLVTLAWEVTVESDKPHDACDLIINLHDEKGTVVHIIKVVVELKVGENVLTGHEVCDVKLWKQTRKHALKLDCIF
jgi:hypothetical protein